MKRLILLLLTIMTVRSIAMSAYVAPVVVDSATNTPLAKASVFDHKGAMVGVCSDRGTMPFIDSEFYPLTIRCMGYAPRTVRFVTDTIRLGAVQSTLPEIVVQSTRHEVLHLLGYVREYSTLSTYSDTVLMYREKLVDFMVPSKSVKFDGWMRPRVLSSKSYYRLTDAYGLDSVSNYYPAHFSWSDWVGVPDNVRLPDKLVDSEAGSFSTMGKYSMATNWNRDVDRISLDVDVLADTANRQWMPDLTAFVGTSNAEFYDLSARYVFDDVYGETVGPANLSRLSFNICTNGRGRNFGRLLHDNGHAFVNTYAEIYIVDREYISAREARKWHDTELNFDDVDLQLQADIPPLQAPIRQLVARVNSIDHTGVRLNADIDKSVASMRLKKKPKTLLGKLRSLLPF